VKRYLLRLGLVIGGAIVGLLMAELATRLVTVAEPQPYQADRYVGTRLKPGFQARFQREGDAWVSVNQAGFRDREHPVAKPPGTFRIAVLGDSFAEAVQVPLEQTFWSVLETELNQQHGLDGRTVEVLNFGISGHGTAQQLQMLRHYVWPYEPDLVLLAFFAGNDIRNNSRQLEPDPVRPFFQSVQGELVLDDTFLQHPQFRKANSTWVRWKVRLINASRLLQLLQRVWQQRHRWTGSGNVEDAPASARSAQEPGLHDQFFLPTDDAFQSLVVDSSERAAWRDAWDVTDQLILAMQRETAEHQARFAVVMVTQAIQVHPDPQVRKAFAQQLGVADLSYPERRIMQLGHAHHFLVIGLEEPFRERAEREKQFVHGFTNTQLGTGHWNAIGHRWAGERIARELVRWWSTEPD